MATIRKRGDTYQIRAYCGNDVTGKHIEKSMTWKPPQGMTKKQIEKELNRQAVMFEEKCLTGQFLDGNITFADFTERWFKDYAEKQLKAKTIHTYRELLPRIIAAMGHIRLCKLQPHHLMEFYNNLSEKGMRGDIKYKPCEDFKERVAAAGYDKKTLAAAANITITPLNACYKGQGVRKSTADKISIIIKGNGLFEPVNADKPLSANTIAYIHRFISSILTTAVQWQVIPSNPCQRVKPPQSEHKEAPVLNEEQTAELIQCLEAEPIKYKTAVMLLLYTGMRRGELCGLNWSDVDFDGCILHISKTVQYLPEKGIYEDTTKTINSDRVIQIPPDMIQLLKEFQVYQLQQRLLLGDMWIDSGKIIASDNGDMLNPDRLSIWFKGFVQRHNLPDIHIHTLRHISATLLIAGGTDIATVSKRLGHSSKTTTLNIYTHAIQSADAKAAERLQNILNPSLNYKAN